MPANAPQNHLPEQPDTLRTRPYVANMYRAAIFSALVLAANGGVSLYRASRTPDDRTMETLTRETLHARRIITPENTGEVTDQKVKDVTESANKLLDRMKIRKGKERPKNGDVVFVEDAPAKFLTTKEENQKKAFKATFFSNLDAYVANQRIDYVSSMFRQLSQHDAWQPQLGWIRKGFEEYKKQHPMPETSDKKAKEAAESELFQKFIIEIYLSRPLVCARRVDGSCLKTWEGLTLEDRKELMEARNKKDEKKVREIQNKGRDCLFVEPLAEAVTLANAWKFYDGLGELDPKVCQRSNEQQAVLFATIAEDPMHLEAGKRPILPPTFSHHIIGLSGDFADAEQAEPYLAVTAGMVCLSDEDPGHCSVAEKKLDLITAGEKEYLDAQVALTYLKKHGEGIPTAVVEAIKKSLAEKLRDKLNSLLDKIKNL